MARSIREAIGIFFDAEQLDEAILDLRASGFRHEELGLLPCEYSIEESLVETQIKTNTHTHTHIDISPITEITFIKNKSLVDTVRSLAGALIGTIIQLSNTDYRPEQGQQENHGDEGYLLLFVRVRNPKDEASAIRILTQHSGYSARVHEITLK